ncbi:hypothetical protein [Helicobacter pylori]|nr:hypothetical protein [Helicobacter pylori]MCK0501395.1 hypothetical protein [Helicobacter pylori]
MTSDPLMGVKMGGLKRYLKNAKNRFTHLFLTILIQKTTPIQAHASRT